jgi:multidrug efflux system membrane fusion protein
MSALVALAACSEPGGATGRSATAEAVPVVVATVRQKDVPVQLRAIGNVEAYSTVSIKSQVVGQLAEVHFEEGQRVKKGDLLFTIDPRPFEAALRQLEANLARDKAQASNADVEYKRATDLLAQGFVSRDEYDTAQTRQATQQAAVKADEAAVEHAKLELQYCYIHAPIDGRVGQILVHQGNVVKENDTTLAVINQIQPIYVSFSVPEQELAQIRQRAAAWPLTVEAFVPQRAEPAIGELRFINNTVDTTTGTVLLKGLFANDDEVLWPGQFVDVHLTLGTQLAVVVVPAEAVQVGQQGQFVWVVSADQTAEVRPVEVGQMLGPEVIVGKGLTAGEQVVTDGQVRLAAGVRVEIKDGAPAAAPTAAPGARGAS